MSRGGGGMRASRLIYCNLLFFLYWTLDYSQFTLLHWQLFVTSPLRRKKTCEIILCHYWSNIYTTLSKLHLAANMFRHLSTPHGAAGGLASIKDAVARTAGQNEERGCWWELCFSLQIFHNRPAFPQQRRVNVQISTGCRSLEKMKMHSDFTLTHVELCNKTFTPGK